MNHAINFLLNSVLRHPLNSHRKGDALKRWFCWHIGSRIIPGSCVVDFVDEAKLVVKPGMRGATENIYTGLYDFEDMSFLIHLLAEGDLFIDIGANVGTYTVLASAVCHANSIALEPIPVTYRHLLNNVNINGLMERVEALNIGVGSEGGKLKFTAELDCVNHVVVEGSSEQSNCVEVGIKSLDSLAHKRKPTLIKIDVEGFEIHVLRGGKKTLASESLLGVILELNESGKRYGYSDKDLHEIMIGHGFSTFNYCPFSRQLTSSKGKNDSARNTLYLRNLTEVERRLEESREFRVNGLSL